jgi:hypothetical protein
LKLDYATEIGSVSVFSSNRIKLNRSDFLKSSIQTEPNRVKIFNKLRNMLVPVLEKVTKSCDLDRRILVFRLVSWLKHLLNPQPCSKIFF